MHSALKAVVFDWAGTMIDFGSRAPVIALVDVFAQAGVPISETEARADMGVAKLDHIRAILAQPRVEAAWEAHHHTPPDDTVARKIFSLIEPAMKASAESCATLIPGAAETVARLRDAGVRIGSCTGYTREMMTGILPRAAEQGYSPDMLVCAGETPAGRPSPLMFWRNLVELGVWPAAACIKVDDAPVGITEGRAAGAWTVGVAASGNGVGLSAEALAALPTDERAQRIDRATRELKEAGAHLVIETIADLPEALAALPIGEPPP